MLIDRPQIVEGSVIVNATVPSGTSNPTNPSAGELFFRTDLGELLSYGSSGWNQIATTANITSHATDLAAHLSTAQNTFLDGLSASLTASEVNYLVGVTSPIQAQLTAVSGSSSTHSTDIALHLSAAQNVLLDGLNLPTLQAADVNRLQDVDSYLTSVSSVSIASSLATLTSTKIAKAGDTITGNLIMSGGAKITGLPTPSAGTDAVNKDYVDIFVQGIHWTQPVKAASTAPISLSGTQTVDGVVLVVGDRVLVKDQASSADNGIYVVAVGTWTRAPDYDTPSEITQSAVFVSAGGTVNGKASFIQTGTVVALGDAATFTPFSGPVINSAGSGIALAPGGTVSVKESYGLFFDGASNLAVDIAAGGGLMTTTDNVNPSVAANAQLLAVRMHRS